MFKRPILFTVLIIVIGTVLSSLIFGVLAGGLFWFWHQLRKKQAPLKAEKEYEFILSKELPDVVDFFAIALSAGLTIRLAIEAILNELSENNLPNSQKVFREVLTATRLGTPLADALRFVPLALSPLTVPLVESERYGTELIKTLELTASQARESHRRKVEIQVRKVPTKLLFPLVMCILPAFGLLTLMPIFIKSFQSLILQ